MTTTPELGPDATTAALPGGPNSEGQKSRPVRVPNVSAAARSGIDGVVLGSNAQDAYDATSEPQEVAVVPEDLTTVDAVLDWVREDDATAHARAQAALDADKAKPEDEQRSTLVGPLESLLARTEEPAEGELTPTEQEADANAALNADPGLPNLAGNGEGVPADEGGTPAV